jgi:tetratricopeptide (TPR) repeat protein
VTAPSRDAELDPALVVWGLPVPRGFGVRLAKLVAPLDPADLLRADLPDDALVELWGARYRNFHHRDELGHAALMHRFVAAFARATDLASLLEQRRMSTERTFGEVDFQAGTACYRLGSTLIRSPSSVAAGRRVLEDALAAFLRAAPRAYLMKEPQRLVLHGQAGVTALRLARRQQQPVELVTVAVDHLLVAEALGDVSVSHFTYLAEAWLLLHAAGDAGALDQARDTLERAGTQKHDSPGLRLNAADVSARGAFDALSTDRDRARAGFLAATMHCTRGMAFDGDASTKAILQGRRGQSRFQLWILDRESVSLQEALSDLRVYEGAGFVAVSLVHALAALAQECRGELDWPGVIAAADEAEAYEQASGVDGHDHRYRLAVMRREAEIALALEADDVPALRLAVEATLDMSLDSSPPIVWLVNGLKALAQADGPESVGLLCRKAAAVFGNVADDESIAPNGRVFAASHGASLLWVVGRCRGSREDVGEARRLYQLAIELDDRPLKVELLSCAGVCTSRLARMVQATGDHHDEQALGLFRDAQDLLARALGRWEADDREGLLDERVTLGRIADAAGRVHAITRSAEDAETALRCLDDARVIGDLSPELEGLRGDVLLRRGRAHRDVADLRAAIAHKEAALAAGAEPSRENRSSCAAAALMLASLGEPDALRASAEFAHAAAEADADWPWPWLQLAEVARRARASGGGSGAPATEPVAQALGGEVEGLSLRAAELAVDGSEFRTRTLGGRSKTYVLSDPHRLLSTSLVLKPTRRQDAQREWTLTTELRSAFRDAGLDHVRVPQPVGIIDRDEFCFYVMRRSAGRQLGALVLDAVAGRRPSPVAEYARALEALAVFHAYTLSRATIGANRQSEWRRDVRRALERNLRAGGVEPEEVAAIGRLFADGLPRDPLLLPRRDAHPENWLVDERGRVVLLDVESSAPQAVVFEVVQLLDDYPLLTPDAAGTEQRLRLTQRYLSALARATDLEVQVDTAVAYAIYAIRRAVFVLTHRSGTREASSSSLRAWTLRRAHARALLAHIARDGPDERTHTLAARIVAADLQPSTRR